MTKKWSGRFEEAIHPGMMAFQASLPVDSKMAKEDLMGSMAHVTMLMACSIISEDKGLALKKGLKDLYMQAKDGTLKLPADAEDVHMAIESILTEHLGDAGKSLHTARSRNDQVAVDLKLYMKHKLTEAMVKLTELQGVLLDLAKQHAADVMPGYTHLQRAQPITCGYHLLAYVQMFKRDNGRLKDCMDRMDTLPLGSGAISGVSYVTDRKLMAELIGFSKIAKHAMDAISDRDHVIEAVSALATIMMHLSRLSEELILWSSQEFGFIRISDGFATGSSMMPQKRNPDAAELIRGKTGRVYGSLMGILTVMKGLPLAYNKDMQEDKEGLFDAMETTTTCLDIMGTMLAKAQFKPEKMSLATKNGYVNATEAADYLVGKGIPFREAYETIAKLVTWSEHHSMALEELDEKTLAAFHPAFGPDFCEAVSINSCMEKKVSEGSTGSAQIMTMIDEGYVDYKSQLDYVTGLELEFKRIEEVLFGLTD